MEFFRFRVVLRITGSVPTLYPFPAPLIHALIAEAFGIAERSPSRFPENVIPHPVEQLRIHLQPGDHYAFGLSVLDPEAEQAHLLIKKLYQGLQTLGTNTPQSKQTFGGNFEVARIEDLIGKTEWTPTTLPTPLPTDHSFDEFRQLHNQRRLTLNFHSPLRWELPAKLRPEGHQYRRNDPENFFNRSQFPIAVFLSRLRGRLERLGLDISVPMQPPPDSSVRCIENRLVWVDLEYKGGKKKGFRPSGALGTLTLELPPDYPVHWLIWGQYTHVGSLIRFGHGGYRIAELGASPFPVERSESWIEIACRHSVINDAASLSDVDPGELHSAAQKLCSGNYAPGSVQHLSLETPGKLPRRLQVPDRIDRGLQRAVCEVLRPGLDALFETSSFAYRRGLGRRQAAKAVESAYGDGFRWALKADFSAFFESVDHRELRDRIHAYTGDVQLSELLMLWVRHADPDQDGQGIPTGAPVSPLLANLFLDQFDEAITASGARLVRYADDFLILFRTEQEARQKLSEAETAAAALHLKLNSEKTRLVSLTEPFDFLGYRFQQRDDTWNMHGPQQPGHLDSLGWTDLARHRPKYSPKILLPGETAIPESSMTSVCVIDSNPIEVSLTCGTIQVRHKDGRTARGPALDRTEQILIVGTPSLSGELIEESRQRGIPILGADQAGRPTWEMVTSQSSSAELLMAQVRTSEDRVRCLQLARPLIAAKIHNYAALSASYPHRTRGTSLTAPLLELAERALQADSVDMLQGLEGTAAAKWYRELSGRLCSRFILRQRVSPRADDPVNVLLNIAQTHLYRQARLAARLIGLQPSLGILHRPRAGFDPLAADLQEPFRFLMDRAVIEVSYRLRHDDFESVPNQRYPLSLSMKARRQFFGTIQTSFSLTVTGEAETSPVSYRLHLLRLGRRIRRAISSGQGLEGVFQLRLEESQPELNSQFPGSLNDDSQPAGPAHRRSNSNGSSEESERE